MKLLSAFTMALLLSSLQAYAIEKELVNAFSYGADAALNIFIHDEDGQAVTGASVQCCFWFLSKDKSPTVRGLTDDTGHFMAKERCSDDAHILVKCNGYYDSFVEPKMSQIATNPKVVNGRWQPYGGELPILLRKKKNPVPLDRYDGSHLKVPVLNEWIGFDMAEGDFVKPHGVGSVADFNLRYVWDGKVRSEYTGAKLDIKFTSTHSGGYWFDKIKTSSFQGCMCADTNSAFEGEYHFFENRNGKKWTSYRFPADKTLIVRSRCLVDKKGRLIEAYYGQLGYIEFSKSHDGSAYFGIGYTRNPQVNDPNLEPEKDRYRTIKRRKGSGK